MIQHDLVQGSPEWLAYRKAHFNASDAPAMMGVSPYKTRAQLLHEMHTGLAPEVDAATQRRFDDGHRFEALARPVAAKIIGEDLYPVTGSEGLLSASFDGLTMMEDTAFEHKTLNDELRAAFNDIQTIAPEYRDTAGGCLPMAYQIQMEQQCMVSGCARVLFMASVWEGETLIEERHCWYLSNPELADKIRAGWDQFALDLANYVPETAAAPAPTGKAPESLPALHIVINGGVQASNLAEFKATALAVFKGINRSLTTDAEFADAEKTVKWCGDVEDRLKAAKEHALSQTESIDALFRTIDDISAEAKRVRLELDKLVKARKEAIREEIVMEGRHALTAHCEALNARIGKQYMPQVHADFAAAIKGKRTVDSLRDAVATTLANAKIEANAIADRIQINLGTLRELAKDHAFLFADTAQIVLKAPDDLTALVKLRIAEHQAKEASRLEAERERIRKEEAARLEREAQQAAASQMNTEVQQPQQVLKAEPAKADATARGTAANESPRGGAMGAGQATAVAPACDSSVLITTQALGDRLGLPVQASLIESLGFKSIKQSKPGVYWRECDVHAIGWSLIEHIKSNLSQRQAA